MGAATPYIMNLRSLSHSQWTIRKGKGNRYRNNRKEKLESYVITNPNKGVLGMPESSSAEWKQRHT